MKHIVLFSFATACIVANPSMVFCEATPIGPTAVVNTFTDNSQNNCDISSADDGAFVYVWDSVGSDTSGSGISAYIDGLPGEHLMNTFMPGDQTDPAVSHADEELFAVVWVSDGVTPGVTGIIVQRFKTNGAKVGTEILVRANTTLKQFPDISHGADGGFVVTWLEGGPLTAEAWGRAYNLNGVALSPAGQISATSNAAVGPRVSHNSISDFVIVWQHLDGATKEIHAVCFDLVGTPICSEFKVNTSVMPYPSSNIDVSHGDDDGFIIVWDKPYNVFQDADILGQRFASTGAPIGGEFVANSTMGIANNSPVIDHGPLGDFVIAWRRASNLYTRCFAPDATPLGLNFIVDQGDFPPAPAISYYDNNEFAVGWTEASDIEGRLYLTNNTVSVGAPSLEPGLSAFARPLVFRDRTEIHFEQAKTARTSVRVLDLQGRVVETLADDRFEAGAHRATWNGRDAHGRDVAAGVYFYAVTTGGETRTGRLIRSR